MMRRHSERSEESHAQRGGNDLWCEMLRCAQHDAGWMYGFYFRDATLDVRVAAYLT
jgi:hypothetical protein